MCWPSSYFLRENEALGVQQNSVASSRFQTAFKVCHEAQSRYLELKVCEQGGVGRGKIFEISRLVRPLVTFFPSPGFSKDVRWNTLQWVRSTPRKKNKKKTGTPSSSTTSSNFPILPRQRITRGVGTPKLGRFNSLPSTGISLSHSRLTPLADETAASRTSLERNTS